ERPIAAIPVARPVPQPPQPTGPVRRGVRNFLGSMYSLMFHSRMDNPSQAQSHSSVLTPLPGEAELPVAEPAAPEPMPAWPPYAPKRRLWPWVLGGVGLFILVLMLLAVTVAFHAESPRPAMTAAVP